MNKIKFNVDEIIEKAWCDKTSFEDIYATTSLSESEVIDIMRNNLHNKNYKIWRKRVSGRSTKHKKLHYNKHQQK